MSNVKFLTSLEREDFDAVIDDVAANYGISKAEALAELTDSDAENVLEYLREPVRSRTQRLIPDEV